MMNDYTKDYQYNILDNFMVQFLLLNISLNFTVSAMSMNSDLLFYILSEWLIPKHHFRGLSTGIDNQ